ncbi:CoA transferase [Rhodobacteraceae bacterium 2CG4]|uniref:CoA transferase n=1 Tax=Halovulum marinum TaxID=2662447 RepID=A0A6L5Z303_9RHOB|nr:CoA transferase [Halovulum marinum]MSU90907.1 CoA transferase [Halovulum marinum]
MAHLEGVRVLEFSHMVMGPTVGMILADLGAEVIKVEPSGGDKTRTLPGSGAGYFAMYNRNKRSVVLDLKSPEGMGAVRELLKRSDVMVENFRGGALDKLGLGYEDVKAINPGIVYQSCKGFLSGPYENRTALDEVAQMMGGLAYMTGPSGRPLRAGASVIDVTGAMFGVIGILSALLARKDTGQGAEVRASLFETTAFLVGQHIAQGAVTGTPAPPMPERISAWAVYDVFNTADGHMFVGVVSDSQWKALCGAFGLDDWAGDPDMADNRGRVTRREVIMPRLRGIFGALSTEALSARLEEVGLPFAPIRKPDDLLDDPQLAAGGLLEMDLPDGKRVRLPALPLEIDGARLGLRASPPSVGADTADVLAELERD